MNDEIVKQFLDNPVEGRLALSASLKNFIAFFHWYMYHQNFEFRYFHNLIVKKLEDIVFERNEKKNLVINISPRFGKSTIMKYFCAWSYMLNPQSNCIYTSYSDDLVNSFSKDIRDIVTSKAFVDFTGIAINKSKSGADYWATTKGGGFRAAPLGGSIIGFGFGWSGEGYGGCCLVDDPNRSTSAKSQAELQNTVDYYLNSIKTRANNQAKSPIILIMQRLALEDLTGYVLENEADDWDLIKIPALDEDTGKALWEERISADELLKIKKATPFVYYGMYQQEPIVIGGSVIKTEWFRYYDPKDVYDYQFTFITSDTAQKKGEANDFSVFSFWGKTFDNKLHLLDMVRGKWEADELRQQVKLCWKKWSTFKTAPYGFYVEDKSSGIGVIQEIKKTDPIPIIPVTRARYKNDQGQWVAADKFSRVMTAAPYLANGWVYLPNGEKDDISSPLLAECAAFRADLSHKHDDMCFVAGTKVATLFGDKNIEEIKKGEYVITPYGVRKVLEAKCTGVAKTIRKFGIEATPNHKFFTKDGYKQFDTLDDTSELDILSLGGLIKWKYKKSLNLMEKNTNLWEGRNGIISLNQHIMLNGGVLKDFTSRFGSFIQEGQFLRAMSFTTKTIILLTTTSLIWSVYQGSNILRCIKKMLRDGVIVKKLRNILKKSENSQKNGIIQKKEESGIAKTQKDILQKSEKQKLVPCVEENFKLAAKQKSVNVAEMQNITERNEQDLKPVYNLTIASDSVYYANRVLVSNCDTLCDAIDIAFGSTGISSIFI
jgi:predicted phage terminase large subunit-like protein